MSKIDLNDMINKRYKYYKQASHRIFCENLNKKEIADEIIKIYETSRLKIKTSSNKYSIYIGTNISDKIKTILYNEKNFLVIKY